MSPSAPSIPSPAPNFNANSGPSPAASTKPSSSSPTTSVKPFFSVNASPSFTTDVLSPSLRHKNFSALIIPKSTPSPHPSPSPTESPNESLEFFPRAPLRNLQRHDRSPHPRPPLPSAPPSQPLRRPHRH